MSAVTPVEAPSLADIHAAAAGLRGVVVRTPSIELEGPGSPPQVWLKPETLQPSGSFKIRGVFHAVASMTAEERGRGLSTVSAGNTAKALAWCGRHFGVEARSLMPEGAPRTKIEAIEALGGTPILVPMDEVFRYLKEHGWEHEPHAFVHPWTDRRVLTGHASLGLELLEDDPQLDSVFVPVGGGGLLGGVGSALKLQKPEIRIFAVEPAGCPSLHASLAAGRASEVECSTICDGVAVPYMTEEVFPLLRELVDEVVLVSEEAVEAEVRRLAFEHHLVAEPSGALALAAARATPLAERGRTACLLTGGSIDAAKLLQILIPKAP